MPSSVIRSYEYSAPRQELRVTFQSGRRYRYQHVPAETYAEMKSAFSKGEFFNAHIRDHFPFIRESSE
jgi:hypothetical protein